MVLLFKIIFLIPQIVFIFVFLCTCSPKKKSFTPIINLPVSFKDIDPLFLKQRKKQDKDRHLVLKQSASVYTSSQFCSFDTDCKSICETLFILESDKKDCFNLSHVQIYHLLKLIEAMLEKKLFILQEIDDFDLKVLLNISPYPVMQIFRTLGQEHARTFLHWIASDWQIAIQFWQEDWDFLFLEILLKEIRISPINSLQEEIGEGRSFFELAWLKQNDYVVFWIDDYFKTQCAESKDQQNCYFRNYCLISKSFKQDLASEIIDFLPLTLKEQKNTSSFANLEAFCRNE